MENITLAGGTLLDNNANSNTSFGTSGHNHSHDHGHGNGQHADATMTTPQPQMKKVTLTAEQQIELSKLVIRPSGQQQHQGCQNHNHGHSHGHSHGHNNDANNPRVQQTDWKTTGGGIQVPAAAMSLMIPLEDIIKGTPQELMEALSTLLRLGQFDKWQQLAEHLIEREKKGETTVPAQQQQQPKNSAAMDDSSQNNNNTNNSSAITSWWLWIDSNGHTLLHWAAKRGDDKRFVEFFMDHAPAAALTTLLHTTSHDNTAMTPLHWACTEPGAQSLGILALFMTSRNDITVNWEVTDASGCTPLLIAAQYGQVEVCAYLLQKGQADLWAMDTSRDTALHWAAYKGSLPVCGLLWWYHEQKAAAMTRGHADDLMGPDQYGQTPMHLAALRGHTSAVRWLLQRTTPSKRDKLDLLYHKDNNGRTPLDLAIHKNRPTVQTVLQEQQDKFHSFNVREKSQWQIWRRHAMKSVEQMTSLHAWKLWMGLSDFADEMDEAPQFPYYYVWFQALMILLVWYPFVFCPVHTPSKGVLWDFPFWHLFNVMSMLMAMLMLHKTTFTNPGNLVVEDEEGYKKLPNHHKKTVQYWRKLYETTLESYATTSDMQQAIQQQALCHTCHIARPLRSKHCRVTRSCVLMFDHHCPFVGNTVGLYNYPYFYVFLCNLAFVHVGFIFNWVLFLHRSPTMPWFWLFLGIFQAMHILPCGGMFLYHTQLSIANLTTNEQMNVGRYDYLNEKTTNSTGHTTRRFKNPWAKSHFRNLLDRLSPTEEMYMLPEHYRQHSQRKNDNGDEERGLLTNYNDI